MCEYPFVAAAGVGEVGSHEGDGEGEDEGERYDDELAVVRSPSTMPVGDEPYISPAYRDLLLAHANAALLDAQRVDADLLK